MAGPLDGVRVVELGVWVAGPAAGGVLADWGADVVKIEPPNGDPARMFGRMLGIADGLSPPFEMDNRGKRSIVLDVTTEDGRATARELLSDADVFLTNVRPAALTRIGLDFEAVAGRNPRLVYGLITGYGESGPDADRAAYDVAAFWARSGLGVSRPSVTSKFGLSKGSFAGNSCAPSGLTCSEGSDIDFSDGGLFDAGGSWGLAAGKGTVTVAAEYRHHNRTNRASFDPRDQVVAGDAGNNAVAEPNHRWGDPDTRDVMTSLNATVPLNGAETRFLYGFGGYSRRTANSAGFYRRALDARNWPQIYPLGFLPVIEPTVVDASGTAGVRGLFNKWTYDASGEYGHNSFAFYHRRHAQRLARTVNAAEQDAVRRRHTRAQSIRRQY